MIKSAKVVLNLEDGTTQEIPFKAVRRFEIEEDAAPVEGITGNFGGVHKTGWVTIVIHGFRYGEAFRDGEGS